MSRTLILAAAISLALAACSGKESNAPVNTDSTAGQPAEASTNPLLVASTLPFQAPAFDKIKDGDYLPAFEEGMRQQLAEIAQITANPEPATFDNTLLPLEKSGAILDRTSRVFFGVVQAAILLVAPANMPSPRSLIILLGLLTLGCFIGAVIGESAVDPKDRWRNRGGP